MVMPLSDKLQSKGMLHEEAYAEIRAEKTRQEKMRRLFDAMQSGGIKSAFYTLLQEIEPHLLKDLGMRSVI